MEKEENCRNYTTSFFTFPLPSDMMTLYHEKNCEGRIQMVRQANYQLNNNHEFMLRSFAKSWRNALLCHEKTEKGNRMRLVR